MSFQYNFAALSGKNILSVYDLGKARVIAPATCNALYRQQPIQTDTLIRILDYADCSLDQFLTYRCLPRSSDAAPRSLDLRGLVQRGIISRTSKERFTAGKTMSLATLCAIAEDQGVNLLDFFRIETRLYRDSGGILKKERKVLYLTEW